MPTATHPHCASIPLGPAPLPRAARLIKASEFTKVFRENRASSDALFRVLWRVNDRGAHRLGMAVSRRVDRRAVGRNRIKRIIRERFRTWRAVHPGADRCYDVVVMPRSPAAHASNAELGQSLARHWQRIGQDRDERRRAPAARRKLN